MLHNGRNSPNQKPLSILEGPLTMNLRMDSSDTRPAMVHLPSSEDKKLANKVNFKLGLLMSFSWFVQSRFLSFSCFMHTRFKWYNIRRPATDTKQADPAYYENLAL
ncbi:hypothetical protein T4D_13108, partial [Trichinella pseudospiralis]